LIARSAFTLSLQLDLNATNAELIGSLTGGATPFNFTADRTFFSAKKNPFVSKTEHFTLWLPHPADTALPQGDGVGVLTASSSGGIRLAAKLGEGTPFSFGSAVSKGKTWPLYVSLYRGAGAISGLVTFAELTGSDLTGQLSWFKPEIAGAVFYPAAFDAEINLLGSRYTQPPSGERVLDFSPNGDLLTTFAGGNLLNDLTINANLSLKNRVTPDPADTHRLKLSIALPGGALGGSFLHPDTQNVTIFTGVIFQKQTLGVGQFKGSNTTGALRIEPKP
jgi:hypothetical protein